MVEVIHWKLDLLVSLMDTSTGNEVEEKNVRFQKNGRPVNPIPRGSGNFVFENCGREDCEIWIFVYGYEPYHLSVRYETLDERMPIAEAYLIPAAYGSKGSEVITFSGNLPGLEQIQAVCPKRVRCRVANYDEKKKILHLIKTNSAGMHERQYGLVHPDQKSYEPFVVEKELSDEALLLRDPFIGSCRQTYGIARIVFGSVSPNGDYLLRVRDDATDLLYLVRIVAGGEERFLSVDMHRAEEFSFS